MTTQPIVLIRRDHPRVAPSIYHSTLNRVMRRSADPGREPDAVTMRERLDRTTRPLPSPWWIEESEETIAGVPGRWLRPKDAQPDAAVLYLHGGAYTGGGPHTHAFAMSHLVRAAGVPFFLADYRLAPEHPYPAAVDDAAAVIDALDERFGQGHLALAGDSAGGGLCTTLMTHQVAVGGALPAAALLIAPWVDLTLEWSTRTPNADHDVMLTARELRVSAEAYAGDAGVDDPGVSPIRGELAGLPPTLIQVGTWDLLFEEGVELASRLAQAGVDVELDTWQGMQHVFQAYWAVLPEARRADKIAATFLRRHLVG